MAAKKTPKVTDKTHFTVPVRTIDIVGMPCTVKPFDVHPEDNRFGQASAAHMEILFNARQCEEQMKNTILHEVLHQLDYSMKLDLKENQVHRLATLLVNNMRSNPEFYIWLMTPSKP